MNDNAPQANDNDPRFSDDLLRGASAIAEFIFGDAGQRRKIFHLAATSQLPTFKMGSMICARKSILLDWIAKQEKRRGGEAA